VVAVLVRSPVSTSMISMENAAASDRVTLMFDPSGDQVGWK
jgi:hypothetical protein